MSLDKSKIPRGIYCYDENGTCPYWGYNPTKPKQESGYCEYLEYGDWECERLSLLWDMCKECGVNT